MLKQAPNVAGVIPTALGAGTGCVVAAATQPIAAAIVNPLRQKLGGSEFAHPAGRSAPEQISKEMVARDIPGAVAFGAAHGVRQYLQGAPASTSQMPVGEALDKAFGPSGFFQSTTSSAIGGAFTQVAHSVIRSAMGDDKPDAEVMINGKPRNEASWRDVGAQMVGNVQKLFEKRGEAYRTQLKNGAGGVIGGAVGGVVGQGLGMAVAATIPGVGSAVAATGFIAGGMAGGWFAGQTMAPDRVAKSKGQNAAGQEVSIQEKSNGCFGNFKSAIQIV
jgi:hypothetical protein